ncbi:SRPBCC family protein [Burkholderia multivorans]|jgi:ribosome-associated toxin RatA of RatAB toxin-antitoxin module|uniref:SRPBCC family protein n=2 Tax=Burkholderia multivorans TaxID=87883 RepID=UPI00057F8906|nr:SRPBCC family protein [Burkholderia multivorans]KHS16496.1 oligoketide cyclase [Burkholderia multivorans]KHS20349.1 oligoketide cyclase [Burkholderia multivorans]MBR7924093.1 SRPBCC family protein [Burkholderia multivorans]MBR8103634.1 SRPBCC family protein [Burkholderia multivorans]MBR8124285.1 SRPBCC family protein [Burkholderia multivorans]
MRISVSRIVGVDRRRLFTWSQDYGRRLVWDSFLADAYLLDGMAADVGVDAFCRSQSGATMVSRYVSYRPPQVAAIEMVDGPSVLERFSASWDFTERAPDSTEVRFTYQFRARPGWLRWLLEPLIGAFYLTQTSRRLDSFKRWAEAEALPSRP